MPGPLVGVNVLDFGQAGVGPWAATLLGMLGANVLKIERPEGEIIRSQAPFVNGLSVAYSAWNMAKKGAILDLKSEAGRRAIEPLIREADVVLENGRAGVMERLKLGWDEVRVINPQIVYASSSGWGTGGPLVAWPGTDSDFQAFSGFASTNGPEGGRPEMARHPYHFDLNASVILASGVISGLIQRARTGEGQRIVSSHLASTLSLLSPRASEYLITGVIPGPLGSASANSAPNQAFRCSDHRYIAVSVESEAQWRAFCPVIGRPELVDDPRFGTNRDRVAHRQALAATLEPIFAGLPTHWWFRKLGKVGVPVGHFYDFETIRNHQHVVQNEMIVEFDIAHQGKVYIGGVPWRFSKTPAILSTAPAPGEHTEAAMAQGFGIFQGEGRKAKGEVGREGTGARGREDGGTLTPTLSLAREREQTAPIQPSAFSLQPLDRVRVVDLSQGVAGGYCSLLLADLGAEVVKVEPAGGDYLRGLAPSTAAGESAAFVALNRNKELRQVDRETDSGRREIQGLVKGADILVENLGPGGLAALGIDEGWIQAENPGLIVAGISGFGETGAYADLPSSELVAQAMADYRSSLGESDAAPLRWGADIASGTTGDLAFAGILAALYHRMATGEGQRVSVNLWATLLCLRQAMWSALSDVEEWAGPFCLAFTNPPMDGWQTADQPVFLRLHNATEVQYIELLSELGLAGSIDDPRFGDAGREIVGTGRYANEVKPIIEAALAHLSAQEVVEIAGRHGAVAIPFNTFAQSIEHPQVAQLDLLQPMDHPDLGTIRVIGSPIRGGWEPVTPASARTLLKVER